MNDIIERRCTGKRRYGDESQANRAAAQLGWKHREMMTSYACADCGGWHLTTDKRGSNPRREFRDAPKLPQRVRDARERDRRRRR